MPHKKRSTAREMPSALGVDYLPAEERSLFTQAFEKERDFLEMLLLLVSRSFALKNVDLIWSDAAEASQIALRRGTGITQALRNPHLRHLAGTDSDPNPRFCNLVLDFGRHPEACFLSDCAGARLARRTAKTQVYRCHAGIMDIAVPVKSGNRYLATLHCGQFLESRPTRPGFAEIRRNVARLTYIDVRALEKAYFELPVIPEAEVHNSVRALEIFAEYLARLWQRLRDGVRLQRHRLREGQLMRTECAHWMLEGGAPGDRARVREVMKKLGFVRSPNRVLVVQMQSQEEYSNPLSSFDLAFTAALHAIEELCERTPGMAAAYLRRYGLCVFLEDSAGRRGGDSDVRACRLGRRILEAIAERCDIQARIGIGCQVDDWRLLPDSYEEARLALTGSSESVAVYRKPAVDLVELEKSTKNICHDLRERRFEEVKLRLASLPMLLRPGGSRSARPAVARESFSSVLESMYFTAQKMGCLEAEVAILRSAALAELEAAESVAATGESFLRAAMRLLSEVRRLHAGKHEKIVERACQMIEWNIEHRCSEAALSLDSVARSLGVSSAHLSRIFRRIAGVPFQTFVTARRVDLAKRLLLDPLNSVAGVAGACGYANPAYFARVFRRTTGCLPREYIRNPLRCAPTS